MITYFVTGAHRYTMDDYLNTWGSALQSVIQVRGYHELASIQWLPGGTYIFSDIERLTPALGLVAVEVWNQLKAAGSNVRLLNHPGEVLRRVELLQTLHAAGRNQFNVHRVAHPRPQTRFPVFIRGANDHEGSRTDLLNSQEAVAANLRAAVCFGHNLEELLLVEYRHTAGADGIHHKYSAFRVADRVIPRHMIFSRQWMLKYPDLLDGDKIAREREYLETNPHEAAMRETFDLAHIDYGRCDYAVVDGRVQVWEINTNPLVMMLPEKYEPAHLSAQEYFATRIRAALEAVNLEADRQLRIPIHFDDALLDTILSRSANH